MIHKCQPEEKSGDQKGHHGLSFGNNEYPTRFKLLDVGTFKKRKENKVVIVMVVLDTRWTVGVTMAGLILLGT